MSDSQNTGQQGAPESGGTEGGAEFKPITSQDDLNKVIADRVARERAKFADYKDLKAKADQFDKVAEANKSEAEKFAERIANLETENRRIQAEALRARIQARHGIADEDAELFLTGTDEETLTRQAERLAQRISDRKKQGNVAPKEGGNPHLSAATSDLRDFTRTLFGEGA